jgi:hypothetical protein
MEMYEDDRPLEILLLRQILSAGGNVHIYEHIDPGPYKRMQKKGWLTSRKARGGLRNHRSGDSGHLRCCFRALTP